MVHVLEDVRTGARSSASPRRSRLLSTETLRSRLANIASAQDQQELNDIQQRLRRQWPLVTASDIKAIRAKSLEERRGSS